VSEHMAIDAIAGRWRVMEPVDRNLMRVVFADGTAVQLIEVSKTPDGEEFLVRGAPLNGVRRNARQAAMVVKSVPSKTLVQLLDADAPVPEFEKPVPSPEWADLGRELEQTSREVMNRVVVEAKEQYQTGHVFERPRAALDIPAKDWAHTSMKLPKPLVDTLAAEAERRVIGRNRMAAIIFEIGLANLPALPEMPGGDV